MAVQPIEFIPASSKNYSPQRYGTGIDAIVFHTTVGTMGGTIATFQNPSAARSAHYVLGLDGRRVQMVQEWQTAWHAGDWPWNKRSIGIEHVDDGAWDQPRPEALYEASVATVREITGRYQIRYLIRHRDIKATSCPGTLDVERIVRETTVVTFDPRNVEADKDYVKDLIRAVVLNESHLTASALKKALGLYYAAPKPAKVAKPTRASVRAGHGKGRP